MASVNVRDRNKNKPDKKPNWEYRFEGAKVNGKRKLISKSGFRTKKEALEAGNKALMEYNSGGQIFTSNEISVNDYFDVWIEQYVKVNLRPKTVASYQGIINNHIRGNLGPYKLNSLTPSILQGFANNLKSKGYSKRHIVNILSTITNALNYAIEPLQYIKHNPMNYVKLPKVERAPKQRIVLKSDDWERIVKRFPFGNKYHIPLIIGYHAGLRISEAFALTWDDINFEKKEISITKQIIKIKPDESKALWCFGPPKTKSSIRTVKIGDTLLKILKSEKTRQNENRLRYGEYYANYSLNKIDENIFNFVPSNKNDVKLICVDENGQFVTTDSFKYCSRVIHHELEIEFDFHSLRHTHATILVENGADIKNVQKRLGHEKIQTTLQTYVHDTEEMAERSVDIFERAIGDHQNR